MKLNDRGWRLDGAMQPEYRARMGYQPRQAVRYTRAEMEQVLAAHDMGFTVHEIATDHQRTEGGIATLLDRMIVRRLEGCDPVWITPSSNHGQGIKRGMYRKTRERTR